MAQRMGTVAAGDFNVLSLDGGLCNDGFSLDSNDGAPKRTKECSNDQQSLTSVDDNGKEQDGSEIGSTTFTVIKVKESDSKCEQHDGSDLTPNSGAAFVQSPQEVAVGTKLEAETKDREKLNMLKGASAGVAAESSGETVATQVAKMEDNDKSSPTGEKEHCIGCRTH